MVDPIDIISYADILIWYFMRVFQSRVPKVRIHDSLEIEFG